MTSNAALPAGLRAGAARAPVTGTGRYGLGGPGRRRAAGVHDDIYARCLALSDGVVTVALTTVDVRGVTTELATHLGAEVRRRVDTGQLHILWGATGACSGPDVLGEGRGCSRAYRRYFVDQAANATVEALRALEPARLTVTGAALPHDAGAAERRPALAEATAVCLDTLRGGTIGVLTVFSRAAFVLGGANTQVSADFLSTFHMAVEAARGGCSVALVGAVDAVPDRHGGPPPQSAGVEALKPAGERLATPVLHALADAEPCGAAPFALEACHPWVKAAPRRRGRRTWLRSVLAGDRGWVQVPVAVFRVGHLELMTVGAALSPGAVGHLREASAAPYAAVAGGVNGMWGRLGPGDTAGGTEDGRWPAALGPGAWPAVRDAIPVM